MHEKEVANIIANALKYPSFSVIKASQQDCGYSPDGFDPFNVSIDKFRKGYVYRPTEKSGYPKVSHPYLRALYSFSNMNAPVSAPNLHLSVPGKPKFLEKPYMSQTVDFRRSVQLLESGNDLAPDQAIGGQAKLMVQSDGRLENVDEATSHYLQGAAAALAVVQLRDPSLVSKLPLISR